MQPQLFRIYFGLIRPAVEAMAYSAMKLFLILTQNSNGVFICHSDMQYQRKSEFIGQADLP